MNTFSATGFRFCGLPAEPFGQLFSLSEPELARRQAKLCVADAKPGFPCRVSLVDAEIGERLLLLPYQHHDVDSSYRASGPIFTREKAVPAQLEVNEVPAYLRHRLLSIRSYDDASCMLHALVSEGLVLEDQIGTLFANPYAAYLHIHNARPGCFCCRVNRA